MLQVLAAALFSMVAMCGLGLVAGTLFANRDRILGALADRGDVSDPGFAWVARVRRVSRPSPALSRTRSQLVRVAA